MAGRVMAESAVSVKGLRDLERAFGRADKMIRNDMKDALAEAAAPVRSDAQRLAGSEFSHMKDGEANPWARMRIGVYRTVAYVAPVERGVKGRGNERRRRGQGFMRPKDFGTLMMERAMEPALEHNREQVARRVEKLLDEVADVWERH